MTVGYVFDIEFVWGFQAKVVGLSKTSPSFYYPPPTTILGAVAEVIAKDLRIGENKGKEIISKLSKELLAIGLRPLNCIPMRYESINRIVAIKITGGRLYPDPKDLRSSFDSPALGRTVFSALKEESPTLRCFLVFRDRHILLDEKEIELNADIFWKIHRIGSKESVVSCSNVETTSKPDIVSNESVVTNYSFPKLGNISLRKSEGNWETEIYIDPFKVERYTPLTYYTSEEKTITFLIPLLTSALSEPKYYVKLDKDMATYSYGNEVVIGKWSE